MTDKIPPAMTRKHIGHYLLAEVERRAEERRLAA